MNSKMNKVASNSEPDSFKCFYFSSFALHSHSTKFDEFAFAAIGAASIRRIGMKCRTAMLSLISVLSLTPWCVGRARISPSLSLCQRAVLAQSVISHHSRARTIQRDNMAAVTHYCCSKH